jgi:pimeloyl-ACP methyl ester carboxylesterase
METVRSRDGTEIAYARSGSGPSLLLVHGTTADHTRWGPVLPAFEEHFTVYAMDRRGRGGSGDAGGYAYQREVEDVLAILEVVGGPADLLGHSFGAMCALDAALLAPNIRRLVIYEPATPGVSDVLVPAELLRRIEGMLASGDREGAVTVFLQEAAGVPPEGLELMRAAPSWQGRIAAAHTIVRETYAEETHAPFDVERLGRLDTPALLLLGGESNDAFKDTTKEIDAMLPNSRIAVLEGQAHIAMTTAPELFTREVLAFLLAPDV